MSEAAATTGVDAQLERLRRAARAGQRDAQLLLAQACMEGRGMPPDPAEAQHWYSVAANLGEPMAMNLLGRCHELGQGTPVDMALAALWYRKSAEAGLDWGMYNYAHLLASGNGVRQDRAAAYRWYLRAAGLGHARAMNFVGRFHENGWEVPADMATAMDWYRSSAEAGDFRGQANYASRLAELGRVGEAAAWLRRSLGKAPARFARRLRDELAGSPHPELRALASAARWEPDAPLGDSVS